MVRPHGKIETGSDTGRNNTGLKRDEPGRSGRLRVRSLAARVLTAVILAAFAVLLALPMQAEAQALTTFVNNTTSSTTSGSSHFGAQSFETGSNSGGYTLSEVEIDLSHSSNQSTSLKIRKNNSSNLPGDLVATLTNPATLGDGFYTFTAPASTTLAASTTYWISVNEGISARVSFQTTSETAETGEAGWSIADTRLWRSSEASVWSPTSDSFLIAIKGTLGGGTTTGSTDATLSGLALEDAPGNKTIALNTTFDADTITYTASVANRIDAVKLTATTNDTNATVAITSDDDTGTPGEAVLNLSVGSNTLMLTVTAEDTSTTKTYTIAVTRADEPPDPTDCPADTDWCTTMGVGYLSADIGVQKGEIWGYRSAHSYGDLGSTRFSYDGTNYSVQGVYRFRTSSLDGNTVHDDTMYLSVTALPDGTVLQVGSRTFTVGTDSETTNIEVSWDILANPLSWTAGQHVTVSLKFPDTVVTPTTFVSNTDMSAELYGNSNFLALSFVTGANAGGFTISEVQALLKGVAVGASTRVRIREDDGNGEPATGTPLATLTNPATLTANSVNTFTAPAGTTLAASRTYWITMNEGISTRASFATTTANGETGETGWSIGGDRLSRVNQSNSWSSSSSSFLIAIKGTTGGFTASTDATLSDLALSDGTLDPVFASDDYEYEASVAKSVSQITVTPTKSDSNASVAYLDGSDNTLTDADAVTDGHQVDLTAGENTIKVTVTAGDTTTMLTYTVKVTRTDVLVSNTGQTLTTSGSGAIQAQSFVTGSKAGGYTISEVELLLTNVSVKNTSVGIKENNNRNRPGALVATLTNPGTLTADSPNTFGAGRYDACCEHDLLDNRERGNRRQPGDFWANNGNW